MTGDSRQRERPVAAGICYFLLVFLFGFVLGVVRTTMLEPRLGAVIAVLIELPVILALSWLTSRRLIDIFSLTPRIRSRGTMGGIALVLLLTSELSIVMPLRGLSFDGYLSGLASAAGALGLAGQLMFALIPLVQALRERR